MIRALAIAVLLAGCTVLPAQTDHTAAIGQAAAGIASSSCPPAPPVLIKEATACPECPTCPACRACPPVPDGVKCPEPEYVLTTLLSDEGLRYLVERYREAIRECWQ